MTADRTDDPRRPHAPRRQRRTAHSGTIGESQRRGDERPRDERPRDERQRDERRPPRTRRVGVGEAARRRKRLVAIVAGAVLAFSLLVGLLRTPVYTAEARLNVGRLDVATQAIPGFVSSVQALAATYSRLVDAEDVVNATAEATAASAEDIDGALSASPIADSPLFRLNATGTSEEQAVERANAAAEAIAAYVGGLNDRNPDGERLLQLFREASLEFAQAQAALTRARSAETNNPSAANVAAATRAQVNFDAARLQVNTYSTLYQQSQQGSISANIVTIFDPASRAASDRRSALQRMLVLGLAAGIILGLVAAFAVENLPVGARRRAGNSANTAWRRIRR